jgi:hypothetical protein
MKSNTRAKRGIIYDAVALFVTTITLVTAGIYTSQLWTAKVEEDLTATGVRSPPRGTLLAIYGLPPLATILMLLTSLIVHTLSTLSRLLLAATLMLGWITTAFFWSRCHNLGSAFDPAWALWGRLCYQSHFRDRFDRGSVSDAEKSTENALVALAGIMLAVLCVNLAHAVHQFCRRHKARTAPTLVDPSDEIWVG